MADNALTQSGERNPVLRIAADSKNQAMDWSLALISQGIESTVEHSEEAGWELLVDEPQHARALEVLRQYRLENLRWPWQQKFFRDELAFDWGSLAWVLLLCFFFWLTERTPGLRDAGVMNSEAVSRGEWWRMFTAVFLHADAAHLAANAGLGFVLLGVALGRYGTGVGLLAAFLAGVAGNAAGWLIYRTHHQGLGASGMVMGCLGLLAAQSLSLLVNDPKALKHATLGLAAGAMLFVLIGLTPGTDIIAHFGGLLAGGLLGASLCFMPRLARSSPANMIAGALFSLLTIASWWLAAGRHN